MAWLANKLAEYGESLHAGDVVLSGALHRMVPVRPGDEFWAEFAHLGSVRVRFTGGRVMIDPRVIADRLIEAERSRSGIPPFTQANPFLAAETAYAAQDLFYGERLAAGERLVGLKLGLTSRVKQLALGIDSPVYGHLTSGMILPFGEPLRLDELIAPKVEPELAFLMGAGSADHVGRARGARRGRGGHAGPGDRRFPVPGPLPAGRFGGRQRRRRPGRARRAQRPPRELVDLSVLGCVFRHGRGIDTATGGAVMGHPAAAIGWLAGQLAGRGQRIEPGQIILSGGLTSAMPLSRVGWCGPSSTASGRCGCARYDGGDSGPAGRQSESSTRRHRPRTNA